MSIIAQRYSFMYSNGEVTQAGLKRAVVLKLISSDEYKEITGEDYTT